MRKLLTAAATSRWWPESSLRGSPMPTPTPPPSLRIHAARRLGHVGHR